MVATQADFLSILSSISTDTAALASVTDFEASASRQLRAGQTVGSNCLDELPSGIRPFFVSVVSQEYAILASNGFTSLANQLHATATSATLNTAPEGDWWAEARWCCCCWTCGCRDGFVMFQW